MIQGVLYYCMLGYDLYKVCLVLLIQLYQVCIYCEQIYILRLTIA